ncbi:MAG: putative Ig domain-containing protein [Bacteroidota bacterium]
MKISAVLSIILAFFCTYASPQSIPPDSLYFGQTPPGSIPQVFAPGIVSLPNRNEAVITFSPDGASVFFYIEKYPQPGNPYILFSNYTNNHWTTPDTIPFAIGRATAEPFFAYSGNRLYMYATNAVNHVGIADLSYSVRQGANWSNPISLGNPPNSESYQYHPCIVSDTSIYFSSNIGHICRSQYRNGVYQARVILPLPINYVGSQTWGDPYVSADESYMIFKSIRPGGFGQNDLYIAYKKQDGTWTNPKNLGGIINTSGDETSGDITADGLYMTYGRNKDLYWVSSGFVDSLRYTNFIPYVKNPIPDQMALRLQVFNFTVPDSTFIDDDGYNTLSFSATLSNGNPLPSWLSFSPLTLAFTGTPDSVKVLFIKVTATDTAGATASSTFKLNVQAPSLIDNTSKNTSLRIFPNPTDGNVTVSIESGSEAPAVIEIINLHGKTILTKTFKNFTTLDLTSELKGIYVARLLVDDKVIISKICVCM